MTIDKNQAAMVEQSPLSEKHWRPDDDGTITIYWPAFFSEARDLLCLSCTVYTLAASVSVFVHKEQKHFCTCTCTLHRNVVAKAKVHISVKSRHQGEMWNSIKRHQEQEEEKQCSWNFSARALCLGPPLLKSGVVEIIVVVFDTKVHGSPFPVHPQHSRSVPVFKC